ncbi:MAG: hypothetical protein M0R49_01125 [Limnochordia bacterium]|nr:hypothetical protein [Limnochordia bacterium]
MDKWFFVTVDVLLAICGSMAAVALISCGETVLGVVCAIAAITGALLAISIAVD